MRKQGIAIVVFTAFMLVLTVGFAVFSDTLTVNGTATAYGTFDMQFTEASITSQLGSRDASAIISNDNKALSINVPKLEYPGAYVLITVVVTNNGSVPSKLTNVIAEGLTDDPTVKVTYEGLEEHKDVTLNNGDTQTFNVKIVWDKASNKSSKNVSFAIRLDYKQAV